MSTAIRALIAASALAGVAWLLWQSLMLSFIAFVLGQLIEVVVEWVFFEEK